jgi:cell division septation protein DedD
MGGKHRITRSLGVTVAVVAVCGVAVLLGYAMGNYAITAITTMRHRPSPAAPPSPAASPPPAGEPRAPLPEASAEGITPDAATGPAAPAVPLYRVQIGPFATRQEAVAAAGRLLAGGYPTYVTAQRPYRVQVGAFQRRDAAARLVAELKAKDYAEVRLVEP